MATVYPLRSGNLMYPLSRLCLIACALGLALEAGAKSAADIFEEVYGSVVVVYGKDPKGKVISLGSGVVLAAGVVVTNCHVVNEVSDLLVRHMGTEYPAARQHSDYDRDVCSLAVPGPKAQVAQLGTTQTLKVGQRVYAIGAPYGLELTLSEGIISSLREVEGSRYIQITAPISAGSSGGGLFDEEGRLIGLPTFYLSEGQQLNFAVPVEWVKALPQRDAAARKATTTVTTWVNRAIELEAKEDWAGLLNHAQRWTQARPSDDAAWFSLGIAYQQTGHVTQAIEAYQKAISIYPDSAGGWFTLGVAHSQAGQKTQAIDAYQKALRINPDLAAPWYNLGNVYEEVGRSAKAIEAYQQALRINQDLAEPWFNLGVIYGKAGQVNEAIMAFQQFLRIRPGHAYGWFVLGVAYKEAGQTAQAIEAFHQTVRINPDDAEAWYNLGNSYGIAGQTIPAIKAFQQAVQVNPDHAKSWFALGLSYKLEGRRGEMMEVYRRLKKLDPKLADQFFNKFILP